jgi:cytochrome c oxidase subunit 2
MFNIFSVVELSFSGFQDPASPIMEGIIDLHNYIFLYLILILVFVVVGLSNILYEFDDRYSGSEEQVDISFRSFLEAANRVAHGTTIELVWTILPSVILILIAVPSFVLLYAMDEVVQPAITLKVIGHQWYWSYEYSNMVDWNIKTVSFDSNMVFEDELQDGELRLLQVDKPFMLPTLTHINVLVTSHDVVHSWAVPSLGFKVDAVPGRLNQFSMYIRREGVYYGQCSELCGVNHGYMPIMIKALPFVSWCEWLNANVN